MKYFTEVLLNLYLWIDHVEDVPEEITFIEGEPGLIKNVLFCFCFADMFGGSHIFSCVISMVFQI